MVGGSTLLLGLSGLDLGHRGVDALGRHLIRLGVLGVGLELRADEFQRPVHRVDDVAALLSVRLCNPALSSSYRSPKGLPPPGRRWTGMTSPAIFTLCSNRVPSLAFLSFSLAVGSAPVASIASPRRSSISSVVSSMTRLK